jgi:drug/metabolite transporter (DMT)-like permease
VVKHPVLALVMASVLFSTGGVLIKWVTWNPMAIAGMRSLIAAATVVVLLGRPRLTFSPLELAGAVAYAVTVITFVAANRLTTAANAIFLQYTAPIYIALLGAWILKERPGRLDFWLLGLSVIGVGLCFVDRLSLAGFEGNLLALLSGLAYASLVMILRLQRHESPAGSLILGNAITALAGLPFAFGTVPDTKTWTGVILLGVFQLGLAYVLYGRALQQVRALDATLISMLEPILNPVWVLMLGERPSRWALAGGSLVIIAATVRGIATARQLRQGRTPSAEVSPVSGEAG